MRVAPLLPIVVLAIAGSCSGEAREDADRTAPITVADAGFRTPESVLHDETADVYLVSNINGSPTAADDNGFITRLTPDGGVLAVKWIDGTSPEVTLHAPKGMALRGDTLFVTDITAVRLFHRETGAPQGAWEVPGATFLNDVAVDSAGAVYATDSGLRSGPGGVEPSGTDALYRFRPDGTPQRLTAGETLSRPNGIAAARGRILLASFGANALFSIDLETGQTSGLPAPPSGQLDGLIALEDGTILVSSWEGRAVYRMGPGGQYAAAVEQVEAPADIGYEHARGRVLIPLFTSDRVEIRPLP
jgi:sugar lactone lactonase YvrE